MSQEKMKPPLPAKQGNSNGKNLETDTNEENLKNIFRQLVNSLLSVFEQIISAHEAKISSKNDSQKAKEIQVDQLSEQVKELEKKVEELEGKVEEERSISLAKIASANRNQDTHFNQTGDRPKHPELISEYEKLKTQCIDPLVNKLVSAINPELDNQKHKEKANDIKADISAIVLIGGQEMMQGKSTGSIELPSEILDEIEKFLCQNLKISNIHQPSQVREQITKLANLAQGKSLYPTADKWEENDFTQAVNELTEKLRQKLQLNFTTLNSDIQTEIKEAINTALIFIQRANCAEQPAVLILDTVGSPYRIDYHKTANGYNDGCDETGKIITRMKIIKTIYPVYFVGQEPKVPAIVTTELLTSTAPKTPEASLGNS